MKKRIIKIICLLILPIIALTGFSCDKQEPDVYVHYSDDLEVDALLNKTKGFVRGVCHPNDDYEQIKGCNIEWIRRDIPYLYDQNGNISESYLAYKARMTAFAQNGIKVMGITPYPDDYIEHGLDPRDPANDKAIQDIALYYLNDLRGCVQAFQICNEMGIEHFTLPLTLKEACRFMGIQLQAMFPERGDVIIGYNNAGLALLEINSYMEPWLQYCDYVGIDLYLGCFEDYFKTLKGYPFLIESVRKVTNKPILINEFGYIGLGQTKTEEEKLDVLQSYGFTDEQDARDNFALLFPKLTKKLQDYLTETCEDEDEMITDLFDTQMANHFYKEIQSGYQLTDYPHTPEGQGRFFTDCIALYRDMDYVCGAFVYCYSDSAECYLCGQLNCPVETGWGLVDYSGTPKPSYYAVRDAFALWK